MTTVLFTFIAAFLFALIATPIVKNVVLRFGLVDKPSERKMHHDAVPRMGGIALLLAFLFPFSVFIFFPTLAAEQVLSDNTQVFGFLAGAAIVFFVGLTDDIRRLSPLIKFVGQLAAALVAYHFGFRIDTVSLPFSDGLTLGVFALPITVFWFVLVINAINLVDGLDGLAAGIGLFVSLAMLFVCSINGHMIEGLAFASLAGALMGFLRYNFYPASIFMGDSGSYFLGYVLAGLSVAGSIKGQVATAMLIPVIALGVPLIDTLLAPLRRFVFGHGIFQPDRKHFHHRLISLGYTQRRAVLFIYALTIILGVGAIIFVHAQNDMAALILFVLGSGVIVTTHYLGGADFLTLHGMRNWAHDLSDEVGFSHDRRSFLDHQVKISRAADLDRLWLLVCEALGDLQFDFAEFRYIVQPAGRVQGSNDHVFKWQRVRNGDSPEIVPEQSCFLKIELPLHDCEEDHFCNFGTLILKKNMCHESIGTYTLKRVDHLRRTMITTLLRIVPH